MRTSSVRGGLILVLCGVLCLAAVPALASTIEFGAGGDGKDIHFHSQGRINFDWLPIEGSGSDPLLDDYVGMIDLDVFAAIGQEFGSYTLQAGDIFTNLDYQTPIWITSSAYLSNLLARDAPPSQYDFSGTVHLTSISFTSENEVVLTGYIDDFINNLPGSSLLAELTSPGNTEFHLTIASSGRSDASLIEALNSSNLSAWGVVGGGGIGGGDTPAGGTPEPGTLLLFGSAIVAGGWFNRRRRRRERAQSRKAPASAAAPAA
ncbi:MAG: PEP-CTERM sorting domain-containing protein [Deltaproteobacteria bacterium]|nr:PEP-CTERM sorting domain-containing protein [Deltaproteobacteria bacterium]